MKTVLTIAGSDTIGGAGIQADLKTMTAHKVYGMSVITALTAQNTRGVSSVMDIPKDFVKAQLDAVFTDIIPDAVKIGMVSSSEIIEAISDKLIEYKIKNIVIDPVMVATSGDPLISEDATRTLKEKLLPLARLITPNTSEAEKLCGMSIDSEETMIKAGKQIYKEIGVPVLVKGGHFGIKANDLLISDDLSWFESEKFDNPNTHGTGCTLSSAIASNLALGHDLNQSVQRAKSYITEAIKANLNLGKGRGPLNHMHNI